LTQHFPAAKVVELHAGAAGGAGGVDGDGDGAGADPFFLLLMITATTITTIMMTIKPPPMMTGIIDVDIYFSDCSGLLVAQRYFLRQFINSVKEMSVPVPVNESIPAMEVALAYLIRLFGVPVVETKRRIHIFGYIAAFIEPMIKDTTLNNISK
jgi:hypothetical protein